MTPTMMLHPHNIQQLVKTRTLKQHALSGRYHARYFSSASNRSYHDSNRNAVVDLRSDTVTQPCKRLRQAMACASVGDDVYGEDPTVSKLETYVAAVLGKDEGLFVPSGTMGNLIAVGAHCRRGDEIIVGTNSHMICYEAAGASAFMGVSYSALDNQTDGGMAVKDIEGAIREDDPHYPRSSLLCVENTQNKCGGRAIGVDRMAEMTAVARKAGLKVHVDGARLWNAAVVLDVKPSDLVAGADTATVCLSKGLGAPVGSVLVGSSEFIHESRRLRKGLGGGMRQAGLMAAAGLEALINNFVRLREDHSNAEMLAKGLAELPGVTAERGPSDTNAVYFQISAMDPQDFVDTLERDYGILMGSGYFGGTTIRAMTHLDVDAEGVKRTVEVSREVLAKAAAAGTTTEAGVLTSN